MSRFRLPPSFSAPPLSAATSDRAQGRKQLKSLFLLLLSSCEPGREGRARDSPGGEPEDRRIAVERADQLPPHTYPVATTATDLFTDEDQFAALAEALEAGPPSDLETYRIEDRAKLKAIDPAVAIAGELVR